MGYLALLQYHTGDPAIMGRFASRLPLKTLAWALFSVIAVANLWLISRSLVP